jgi:hypothetical protein
MIDDRQYVYRSSIILDGGNGEDDRSGAGAARG